MRAGIGLIGLLVGVGLLVWLFAATELPKAKVGKQVQSEARQMSGRGEDGVAATESFAAEPDYGNSKLRALVVTSVTAGGAMQTHFGLMPGDRITGINGTRIHDISNGDDGMAQAQLSDAFARRQPITVERSGQTLTLPAPAGSPAVAAPAPGTAGATPGVTPPAAAAPQRRQGSALGDQLDAIQNAAGSRGEDQQ